LAVFLCAFDVKTGQKQNSCLCFSSPFESAKQGMTLDNTKKLTGQKPDSLSTAVNKHE